MKKFLAILLMMAMVFSLAACGGGSTSDPGNAGTDDQNTSQTASDTVEPAKDGELTLSSDQIAVVVNGTKVLMPYNLSELESAGITVSEDLKTYEMSSGDSFGLNLYLDENEEYLLIPNYYNEGDESVVLTDAEAKTITMTTYASEPADQGVSLLGVTFGMTKGDVKALLGDPMTDDGSYCSWQIVVSDADYIGNISMYFTGDTDDAGASEIRLDFMQW